MVLCLRGKVAYRRTHSKSFINIFGQLAAIIFFVAFVQMMYYLGVMQWVIGKLSVYSTLLLEAYLQ